MFPSRKSMIPTLCVLALMAANSRAVFAQSEAHKGQEHKGQEKTATQHKDQPPAVQHKEQPAAIQRKDQPPAAQHKEQPAAIQRKDQPAAIQHTEQPATPSGGRLETGGGAGGGNASRGGAGSATPSGGRLETGGGGGGGNASRGGTGSATPSGGRAETGGGAGGGNASRGGAGSATPSGGRVEAGGSGGGNASRGGSGSATPGGGRVETGGGNASRGGAGSNSRPQPRPVYTAPPQNGIASRTANGSAVLHPDASRNVLHDVNNSRAGMRGVNARPLPQGNVTMHANGHLTVQAANGNQYGVRRNGTLASATSGNRTVNYRPDGRVSAIRTPNMDINRGIHGERVVISHRPDHSVLVSSGRGRGYLERTVVVGNRTMYQRTYVVSGRVYTRAYERYSYRGLMLPRYVPAVYFAPAFYGWAFYPWERPVRYTWGWNRDPWVSYYGGYFEPYPTYAGPSAWLTDYLISQSLADAYAMRDQAAPIPGIDDVAASGPPPEGALYAENDSPITPQLKAAISEEVSRQLAAANAVASGKAQPSVQELPESMKPGQLFLVSSALNVETPDEQSCALSAGDVLRLETPPADENQAAALTVASSKKMDCPVAVVVNVSLQDLAEMQNNLRAQLDGGLQALRDGQGKGGLPAAPQSAIAPPPRPVPDGAVTADPSVAGLLDAQAKEAAGAEAASAQALPNPQ